MKLFKLFLFSLFFVGTGYLQANDTASKVVSRDIEAELCAHIVNCDSKSFDGLFTWYLSRIEKARRPGLIRRLEEHAIKIRDEKKQLAIDIAELDTIIAHINEDHEENCPLAYPLGCELMMLQGERN